MKKILGRIVEVLGYMAVIATYVLYYLTKKKMGVQRDFIFRNEKWMDVLFTGFGKYIFIALVLLGIIYLLRVITKNFGRLTMINRIDQIVSISIGLLFLALLMVPNLYKFTGLPMLLVSIAIVFLGRLINTQSYSNRAIHN